VDAGRKIHRRDFYRFVESLAEIAAQRVGLAAREANVVTLADRMPASAQLQRDLYNAVTAFLSSHQHQWKEGGVGPVSNSGACLFVFHGRRPDDTSVPVLAALQKASSQLTGTRPGFITVQYDDIEPSDLASVHLRRKAGAVSYYPFAKDENSHVVATAFSAYRGLVVSEQGRG
jgi:hypothetical protein